LASKVFASDFIYIILIFMVCFFPSKDLNYEEMKKYWWFVVNINLEKYRLNEVDNANLPYEFFEMEDFIYFYECMLKWTISVNKGYLYYKC